MSNIRTGVPHLRIARPSRDLAAAERFWVGGLTLDVLWRATAAGPGGHDLLMLGWPDAHWHLELVAGDVPDPTPPPRTCWSSTSTAPSTRTWSGNWNGPAGRGSPPARTGTAGG